MHQRLASVIALAALGVSAVPAVASAAPPEARATRALAPAERSTAGTGSPVTVTLPTGEQLTVSGTAGAERIVRRPTGAAGVPLVTRRVAGRTYALPVTAEPYLGRQLDLGAFDVTALAAAQRAGTAKSPVPALGAKLLRRWAADREAGRYTAAPIDGAETLRAATPQKSGAARRARAATYPLVVSVTGWNGQPLAAGTAHIVNMDDGRTYDEYVNVESGEVKVSVPAGTYSVVGQDDDYTPGEAVTWTGFQAWAMDVKVGKSGGTATLDYTRATIDPTPVTPKPAVTAQYGLSYAWVDARGEYVTAYSQSVDGTAGERIRLSPLKAATVGRFDVTQLWELRQEAPVPSYAYWLSAFGNSVAADPGYRFTAAQLAPVRTAFYGDGADADGPTASAGFARAPDFTPAGAVVNTSVVNYDQVPTGTRRVEYLGALAKSQPRWLSSGIGAWGHEPDNGNLDQQLRTYPPGQLRVTEDWFKGPWASGIPTQSAAQEPFCFACREGDRLHFRVAGFTDADRRHVGISVGSQDENPVARVRLYQGKTLLDDESDQLYTAGDGPAKSADYKVLVDFDRRQTEPVLSTKSTTEYTFRSARDTGPKVPKGWSCDIDGTGGSNCRMLPVVQASLDLPVSLSGSLPVGASTVRLTVGRIQGAGTVAITSGRLEVRRSGTSAWTTVELQSLWGGRFKGTVDNSAWAGQFVDVRYGGTDVDGNSFLQTVTRAYRVD